MNTWKLKTRKLHMRKLQIIKWTWTYEMKNDKLNNVKVNIKNENRNVEQKWQMEK